MLATPFLNEQESHVKAKMGGMDSQQSLLLMPPWPCSHPRAPPCELHGQLYLQLHHQHLPVPAPASPGVVRGRVVHLLHPSRPGHPAEPGQMAVQAAWALLPLPACAHPALRPPICQRSGPLVTLPVQ